MILLLNNFLKIDSTEPGLRLVLAFYHISFGRPVVWSLRLCIRVQSVLPLGGSLPVRG